MEHRPEEMDATITGFTYNDVSLAHGFLLDATRNVALGSIISNVANTGMIVLEVGHRDPLLWREN